MLLHTSIHKSGKKTLITFLHHWQLATYLYIDMMVVLVLLVMLNSFNSVTSFYAFAAIYATVFSSLYCVNDLGRSEVQALAKQHKIRANLKTSEILAQLKMYIILLYQSVSS